MSRTLSAFMLIGLCLAFACKPGSKSSDPDPSISLPPGSTPPPRVDLPTIDWSYQNTEIQLAEPVADAGLSPELPSEIQLEILSSTQASPGHERAWSVLLLDESGELQTEISNRFFLLRVQNEGVEGRPESGFRQVTKLFVEVQSGPWERITLNDYFLVLVDFSLDQTQEQQRQALNLKVQNLEDRLPGEVLLDLPSEFIRGSLINSEIRHHDDCDSDLYLFVTGQTDNLEVDGLILPSQSFDSPYPTYKVECDSGSIAFEVDVPEEGDEIELGFRLIDGRLLTLTEDSILPYIDLPGFFDPVSYRLVDPPKDPWVLINSGQPIDSRFRRSSKREDLLQVKASQHQGQLYFSYLLNEWGNVLGRFNKSHQSVEYLSDPDWTSHPGVIPEPYAYQNFIASIPKFLTEDFAFMNAEITQGGSKGFNNHATAVFFRYDQNARPLGFWTKNTPDGTHPAFHQALHANWAAATIKPDAFSTKHSMGLAFSQHKSGLGQARKLVLSRFYQIEEDLYLEHLMRDGSQILFLSAEQSLNEISAQYPGIQLFFEDEAQEVIEASSEMILGLPDENQYLLVWVQGPESLELRSDQIDVQTGHRQGTQTLASGLAPHSLKKTESENSFYFYFEKTSAVKSHCILEFNKNTKSWSQEFCFEIASDFSERGRAFVFYENAPSIVTASQYSLQLTALIDGKAEHEIIFYHPDQEILGLEFGDTFRGDAFLFLRLKESSDQVGLYLLSPDRSSLQGFRRRSHPVFGLRQRLLPKSLARVTQSRSTDIQIPEGDGGSRSVSYSSTNLGHIRKDESHYIYSPKSGAPSLLVSAPSSTSGTEGRQAVTWGDRWLRPFIHPTAVAASSSLDLAVVAHDAIEKDGAFRSKASLFAMPLLAYRDRHVIEGDPLFDFLDSAPPIEFESEFSWVTDLLFIPSQGSGSEELLVLERYRTDGMISRWLPPQFVEGRWEPPVLLDRYGAFGNELGQLDFPVAVSLGPKVHGRDTIFVTDSGNHRIQHLFADTGESINSIGKKGFSVREFFRPYAVHWDHQRSWLWVTDTHLDRVSIYDQNYQLVEWFDSMGCFADLPCKQESTPFFELGSLTVFNHRLVLGLDDWVLDLELVP